MRSLGRPVKLLFVLFLGLDRRGRVAVRYLRCQSIACAPVFARRLRSGSSRMRSELHREVARLLAQLRRICSVAINKQLAVVGASWNESAVLARVFDENDVPQSELAYDAAIDPAAVSRLIRDMMQAGTITTRVDP